MWNLIKRLFGYPILEGPRTDYVVGAGMPPVKLDESYENIEPLSIDEAIKHIELERSLPITPIKTFKQGIVKPLPVEVRTFEEFIGNSPKAANTTPPNTKPTYKKILKRKRKKPKRFVAGTAI
jgi:hypothetical protein